MEQRGIIDGDKEKKWKGKAKEDPATSSLISPTDSRSTRTTHSDHHSESALSRLAASSASITSSMMAQNYKQHIPNILASSKAESSSTSQHSGTALQETARVTHAPFPNAQPELGTTFKSTNSRTRGSPEDNSFSDFLKTAYNANGESRTKSLESPRSISHGSHAITPATADGSAVVELLETGLIEEEHDYELEPTTEELSTLKKALFGEKSSTGMNWDDALNFVPDFISNRGDNEAYRQLAQHLGVTDVAEARDIWFTQWGNVLSSYTDEVWGDLRPLVTTARQELQRISTSPDGATTHGLNAVRRLQQILTHIRDSR